MILGIGTDIVEIARVEAACARTERFAKRILTNEEHAQMRASSEPSRFLAKRFAAKEAIVKALGTGIGNGVAWHMIQINHDELGKPIVAVFDELKKRFDALEVRSCHVSISDEQAYATAFAVIETA